LNVKNKKENNSLDSSMTTDYSKKWIERW